MRLAGLFSADFLPTPTDLPVAVEDAAAETSMTVPPLSMATVKLAPALVLVPPA